MDYETYFLIISVKNPCPFPITYLPKFLLVLWYMTDIQLRFYGHTFLSCQLPSFFVIVFRASGCCFLLFRAQLESGVL